MLRLPANATTDSLPGYGRILFCIMTWHIHWREQARINPKLF